MSSLRRYVSLFAVLLSIVAIAVAVSFLTNKGKQQHSSELGFAASSLKGDSGGFVVPASCPSYAHTTGECTSDPQVSCTPTYVTVGGTTVCTWQCDTGMGDSSSAGIGFSTSGASSGSSGTLHPTLPSNSYGVQCYPSNRQTIITVNVVSPTLSISASPTRIRSGSSSTITWSAAQVTSCTVSGPSISSSLTSGSRSTGALTARSTYTLTCQTSVGQRSASATVFITPVFREF